MAPNTKTIKQTALIPAKPVQVYDAILNARKRAAFTGARADCEAKAGGKFTAYDAYSSGKNAKLERARRIVQEWQTREWPAVRALAAGVYVLKPKDDGTEVTMVHSKVPTKQAESYRQGWIDYYREPLK